MTKEEIETLQTAVMAVVCCAVSDGYKSREGGATPKTILKDVLSERTYLAMDMLMAIAMGGCIVALDIEQDDDDDDRTIN